MAEGFITRRGGVGASERTASPNINFVSKGFDNIVVTFTNAEANEVDIFYGITSTLTDKVTVLASGTSSNVTFSGLDGNTPYTISAYAIVTNATLKKIKSEIISTSITTDLGLVYTAATGGTTLEYNSGGKRYKSHTFTSSGNFVVSTVGDVTDDRNDLDYLIIAGGGGGGGKFSGAGGGAGGYRTTLGTSGGNSTAESKITANAQSYTITVGGGGNGGSTNKGSTGVNSSALGITSTGGGGGGGGAMFGNTGLSGGSGGGRGGRSQDTGGGASGIAGQGSNGGGNAGSGFNFPAGGGGGAGGTPTGLANFQSSSGGIGLSNILRTGSTETRAGGGGGGGSPGNNLSPGNGLNGGGNGGSTNTGVSGNANTGGGGGGAGETDIGGAGGSGIVIIRYEVEAL